MRSKLLSLLLDKGTLLEPEAASYILEKEDPISYVEDLFTRFQDKPFMITMEEITRAEGIAILAADKVKRKPMAASKPPRPRTRDVGSSAKDCESDIRILKDITGDSTCQGSIDDFHCHFKNRFHQLSEILKQRRELRGCEDISKAKRLMREIRFVCMVRKVNRTRSGHLILDVEDETDTVSVLIPPEMHSDDFIPDEVLGIMGKTGKNDLMIAKRVFRPDVPPGKRFNEADVPVSVAFLGDIHVGSKTFLPDRWAKLVEWLGNSDDLARRVKYVVIPGDAVDGIGIYPGQDKDLEIDDIYGQYERLAGLLSQLPDHVEIILQPGNHDAVRPAEPQPALPSDVRKVFQDNVTFVGNPCLLSLHGVEILSYHGRSLDDFVGAFPEVSYEKPLTGMREMLIRRHLAPIYGGKTPIAPEREDYLAIARVPDVFATGHVHWAGIEEYKGVVMINCSTWQSQTAFQRMHNMNPIVCRVPIVNLESGAYTMLEF
ncbi:MAG: DNA-directed DNA polymerase II small subunit [Thermoplasmata archaeon]|nr:DNA-directed DNA polymerase II small subunit [Thermoplasmata archaeon]